MQPFQRHEGVLAPFINANVDTDQIIPARFLHRARREGYGNLLFHDLRYDEAGAEKPGFVLNRPAYRTASILVAGPNFGCGSSREQAVWALVDQGFRAVIAPGFGDIFYNNCFKNGLLAVVGEERMLAALTAAMKRQPGVQAVIDLPEQHVRLDGECWSFDIDSYRKQAMLEGASEIQMTLKAIARIETFEAKLLASMPWSGLRKPIPNETASSQTAGE
ncbi:MAG: 3-isopropylmalate dehydratase small subunit [Hyphomicrobiales bacterium]|nr:3-isopropylmalate dehydratase small subunit [Hyphomicrobiales bacterium]